jgi:2-furoate---CoA ligase
MLDLGRSFLASVERSPDQLALVDGDLRLSYAGWFEKVKAVACRRSACGAATI